MKIKATIYPYAYRLKWEAKEKPCSFGFLDHEPGENFNNGEFQVLPAVEIEYEVPDNYDFNSGVVANLQAAKQRLMAEFQNRITEIERQIQEHLAIPMQTALKEEGLSEGDLY